MHKLHADRLLALAVFLSTLPTPRLYLGSWRGRSWNPGRLNILPVTDEELAVDRSTCADALGWACTIADFKREGLRWDEVMPVYKTKTEPPKTYKGINAAMAFFNLKQEDYDTLFTNKGYASQVWRATPKDVAERIEQFVKSKQT